MLQRVLEWDREVFVYLNGLGAPEFDSFWSLMTTFSTWIPLFVLFFVLIFLKYPRREAFFVCLSLFALVFFIIAATDLTKESIARPRPNNELGLNTIIRILKHPTDYSFFSGHAASSFSVTTLVVLFLRKRFKWYGLFYVWPFLFAYSRIYLGVHYPLDILVGALVGVFSAWLFYALYVRLIVPYLGLGHP